MSPFKYFICIAVFFTFDVLYAQSKLESYISKNGKEFSLNVNEPLPEDFLDIKKEKYKVYFSGEIHGIPSNPIVKYKMLEYLYKYANVRNLIIESGISRAFLAQLYFETGNEDYLCSCLESKLDFWRALRTFQMKLHPDDRIRIIGIDFERNEDFIKAMKNILPDNDPPVSISESVQMLRKVVMDSLVKKERIEITASVAKQLKSYPLLFQEYLGTNFGVFSKIINNPVPYTAGTNRDKQAYKHFLSLVSEGLRGNIYGQYGISHVNLSYGNISEFINSDKNSPFVDQVYSIIPHYYNCTSIRNFSLMNGEGGFGILNQARLKKPECIAIGKNLNFPVTLVPLENLTNYKKLQKGASSILLVKDQHASRDVAIEPKVQ